MEEETMTDLERAREFFKNDRYASETTGIVIEEVSENYAKCSLKLDERHLNAVGNPMGGVMYTLADFVFAVSTNFGKDTVTVTAVSQICYLGAPKGKVLYGESRLLKDGRTTCFYEVDFTDDLGTKVAVVTTTGSHIQRKA